MGYWWFLVSEGKLLCQVVLLWHYVFFECACTLLVEINHCEHYITIEKQKFVGNANFFL